MVEIVDLQPYWKKLADEQPFTATEVQALLKMAQHFQGAAAYLADCQAATAEGLPASASKSSRARHLSICDSAAKLLDGDSNPVRFPTRLETARQRCLDTLARHGAKVS